MHTVNTIRVRFRCNVSASLPADFIYNQRKMLQYKLFVYLNLQTAWHPPSSEEGDGDQHDVRGVIREEAEPYPYTLGAVYEHAQQILNDKHNRQLKAELPDNPFPGSSSLNSSGQLSSLSQDTMDTLLSFLPATELALLGLTSKSMRSYSLGVVPGGLFRLLPHQVRCLNWMMQREASAAQVQDPTHFTLITKEGMIASSPCTRFLRLSTSDKPQKGYP